MTYRAKSPPRSIPSSTQVIPEKDYLLAFLAKSQSKEWSPVALLSISLSQSPTIVAKEEHKPSTCF